MHSCGKAIILKFCIYIKFLIIYIFTDNLNSKLRSSGNKLCTSPLNMRYYENYDIGKNYFTIYYNFSYNFFLLYLIPTMYIVLVICFFYLYKIFR